MIRKIVTKTDKEKVERRNQTIMTVGIVLLFLFSTAGFAFFSGQKEDTIKNIEYNGYEFILTENGYWYTEIESQQFGFQYSPLETEDIPVPPVSLGTYASQPLYFDSENAAATSEIARNLQNYVSRIGEACIEEENCKEDLPIKNCSENIIIINYSNDTAIKVDENCVFIEGNSEELVRETDAFLYKLIGVK